MLFTDEGKLCTKKADSLRKREPLADLIITANTTNIKAVTYVIDTAIIKRGFILFHPQKDE